MNRIREGKNTRLVYTTDQGRVAATRVIRSQKESDGIVRIRRESSGRRGNAVTTITGIFATDSELKTLAKKLKRLCGSGGTIKSGVIEIQGDHRDKLLSVLSQEGYAVKLAGG